jgi:hypothetical protein
MPVTRNVASAAVFAFAGALFAQTPADTIAQLSREVRQLQIELTQHKLESHQARARKLEKRAARAEDDLRRAEGEEVSGRSELLTIDTQLARSDLPDDERSELQNLRNNLLTDGQQRVKQQRATTQERQTELTAQLARERGLIRELEQRLAELQPTGNPRR